MNSSNQNTALDTLNSLTSNIIQGKYLPREKLHIETLAELTDLALNRDIEGAIRLIEKRVLTHVELIKRSLYWL